jgi:photosystem II stability/assembly factor-like uncharacterized protein
VSYSPLSVSPVATLRLRGGRNTDSGAWAGEPWRSADSGQTWAPIGVQGPFVADPVATGTLYAIGGTTLECSTDDGATWAALANDLPAPPTSLVPDPVTEGILFAVADGEVYKSVESGAHWVAVAVPAR